LQKHQHSEDDLILARSLPIEVVRKTETLAKDERKIKRRTGQRGKKGEGRLVKPETLII